MIAGEVESAVKELVTTKLGTMVEKSLGDILRTSIHNAQRGIQSVIYRDLEQVMRYRIQKDVIGEMIDAHIAKFLDTDAVAEGLSTRLQTSSWFIAPIVTYVWFGTNPAMDEKKYTVACALKEPMDTAKMVERRWQLVFEQVRLWEWRDTL